MYRAVIVAVSEEDPVKLKVQLPLESRQLGALSDPEPVNVNVTVPVGVRDVPAVEVSVTATVHLAA